MEAVNHGAVKHVLTGLRGRRVRVARMTAIGMGHHEGVCSRSTGGPDRRRRSERLLRASGLSCTIVRAGWFDGNTPDPQRRLLQGGRSHTRWTVPKMPMACRLRMSRSRFVPTWKP